MYLLTYSLSIRQSCVLVAVSLITSEQFCESYSKELDNVVLAILPLMLLGYHGNSECSHILKIVSESSLSKCHPLLRNLNTIAVNEGQFIKLSTGFTRMFILLSLHAVVPYYTDT